MVTKNSVPIGTKENSHQKRGGWQKKNEMDRRRGGVRKHDPNDLH